jgi:hypothetical protein
MTFDEAIAKAVNAEAERIMTQARGLIPAQPRRTREPTRWQGAVIEGEVIESHVIAGEICSGETGA